MQNVLTLVEFICELLRLVCWHLYVLKEKIPTLMLNTD
jgi:hypothetical protein